MKTKLFCGLTPIGFRRLLLDVGSHYFTDGTDGIQYLINDVKSKAPPAIIQKEKQLSN